MEVHLRLLASLLVWCSCLSCVFFSVSIVLDVIVSIIYAGTVSPYIPNQSTHSLGNASKIMSKEGKRTKPSYLCGLLGSLMFGFPFVPVGLNLPLCVVLAHLGSWS